MGLGKRCKIRKIIKVCGVWIGNMVLIYYITKWQQNCINVWKEQAEKNRGMFVLMNQWTNIKQEKRNLEEYFINNRYFRIAVYGMGDIGKRLIKELRDSEIKVAYGIDRNCNNIYSNIKVMNMDDNLAEVDAVVVTVIKEFDAIRGELLKRLNCPVIAIEDVLNEV